MAQSKVKTRYGAVLSHFDIGDFLSSTMDIQKTHAAGIANDIFWQLNVKLRNTDLLVCIVCTEKLGICKCSDQFLSSKCVMPVGDLLSMKAEAISRLTPRAKRYLLLTQAYWKKKLCRVP